MASEKPSEAIDKARDALARQLTDETALLKACLKSGRWQWAKDTAARIGDLARNLDGTISGVQATAQPFPRKAWVPPTPEEIKESLLRIIGVRTPVTNDGPLVVCTFNGQHLKPDKVERLSPPLLELVKRAHIICVQETNADALRILAKKARYGINVSHRNNREQACGILFHPRVMWLGHAPIYHDYLMKVPDHAEMAASLRPAIQRRVYDRATSLVIDIINLHAKSNVGGAEETRPIRRYQFEQLVEELKRQEATSPYAARVLIAAAADADKLEAEVVAAASEAKPVLPDFAAMAALPLGAMILAGDFNAPLEKAETTEVVPLTEFGMLLQRMADDRWTHEWRGHGGQYDGFFVKGMGNTPLKLWSPPISENRRDRAFYRDLSDHQPSFLEVGA